MVRLHTDSDSFVLDWVGSIISPFLEMSDCVPGSVEVRTFLLFSVSNHLLASTFIPFSRLSFPLSLTMNTIFACICFILALFNLVNAHGSIQFVITPEGTYNDSLPGGDVIPSPVRRIATVSPVTDVQSSDLACGNGADPSAGEIMTVHAGDQIHIPWRSGIPGVAWPHTFGVIMTYMGKCSGSASACDGTGVEFFKIAEQGLRSDGTWAMKEISESHPANFTIPSNVQAGQYLIRHELLALHNAMSEGGAEFYVACIQTEVTGGGNFQPSSSDLAKFPGTYQATDPGILVDIFDGIKSYEFPGPPVVGASATPSSSSTAPSSSSTKKCKAQKRTASRVMRNLTPS